VPSLQESGSGVHYKCHNITIKNYKSLKHSEK